MIANILLNNILIILGILLVVFLIIDVWILNLSGLKDWLFYIFKKEVLLSDERKKEVHNYLNEIRYYALLSEEGKEKFLKRTLYVIRKIEFSSSEVFELTLRNQVLVAASIVKITFGLRHYVIDSISHVKIFQKEIMNPRTKQQFYGLMFTSGKMYLSWERFEHGIKTSDDGLNLGVHEATHGLFILLKHSKLNFEEFEVLINHWQLMAEKHIAKNKNDIAFFRHYASANREEFFSVLLENFFERPQEMKKLMPELYDNLCVYLNQNPLNIKNDCKLEIQQELIAEGAYKNSTGVRPLNLTRDIWHWSHSAWVLLGFFSLIANLILKNFLASTFGDIFLTYLFSFPFVFLVLKNYFVRSGRMSLANFRILSFFSLSPSAVCLILLLNLSINFGPIESKKYPILRVNVGYGLCINGGDMSFLERATEFCELESDDSYSIIARKCNDETSPFDTIVIQYHYGLTGLKILDGNYFIEGGKNK